ncbi:2-deoxyribose-5-phosphate aldolase [Legionella gratiana]|uniref:deoxyribose-phosphate aldolase n=1 Tax=Legionella gratiana TaxID=45066 RepID=A0A378JBZ4_9GAMM|nr:deoxyribose-phosphate aldolase [Legionella gratiana]KTD15626.1 2-deoxyribose-5-phosphate aldolase [Legionella gratiana]STX44949.1 2-deoxyribose-5-phosphate aldolase [Legionella gratiana]
MTVENDLNKLMEKLLGHFPKQFITVEQLIHSIDLTLLDEHATTEALSQLKQEAQQNQVAALCLYMQHVPEVLPQSSIPLATVINFPQGTEPLDASLTAVEKAALLGVTEIDYVLPYSMYLGGQTKKALHQCLAIAQLCKQHKLVLKVILETGVFPNLKTIYTISKELIELECDFIKTSTGKISQGASLSAAFTILSAIKDTNASCGIKISGGIKKPQQAFHYAVLAELMIDKPINKNWFRIGASSLLDELLKTN